MNKSPERKRAVAAALKNKNMLRNKNTPDLSPVLSEWGEGDR